MQQNCQITRCVRQHVMDSVLKSAKPRHITTWQEAEMSSRPVSPKSHELHGDKFANCISNNSDFDIFDTIEIQNRIRVNGRIDLWTVFAARNIPCIAAVSVFRLGWSECDVTYGTLGMAAIVCWQSEADCAEPKSEPNVWNTSKLPCAAQRVGIVHFYAVTEIKGLSCRLRCIREWRNLLTSAHVGYRVSHVGSREWRVTKIWGPRGERD